MSSTRKMRPSDDPPAAKDKSAGRSLATGPVAASPIEATIERALRYALAGDYENAFDQLTKAGKSPPVLNARGVCLLRMGRIEAATRVFRELVLNAGATWMRSGLPVVYKTNYATALLLGGHPSGCLAILKEINNDSHPSVARLHDAIRRWESSLSFWQRLNWRFGKIDPSGRPVQLDFTPGEFGGEGGGSSDVAPQPTSRHGAA